MRVRFLRSIGLKDMRPRDKKTPDSLELAGKPDGTAYQEGETADVKDKDAERFFKYGLAERVAGEGK